LVLVVALFSTVAATGAFAREFGAADTKCEDDPTVPTLHRLPSVWGRPTVKARLIADRTQSRRGVTRS